MAGFITSDGADYLMSLFAGVTELLPEYWLAIVTEQVGASQSAEDIKEPLSDDYYRVSIVIGPDAWTVAYGTATNTVLVALPVPGIADWTGIVGWAICDSFEGGRVLYAGDNDSYDVVVGDQTYLPPGAISLAIDLAGWREVT